MLYLMFNSTQLNVESFKTSQEMLFSQAFNHPSSVTASVLYLIHTQVMYKKWRIFFPPIPIQNNAAFSFYCWIPLTAVDACKKCCFTFLFLSLSQNNKAWIRVEKAIALERPLPMRVSRIQTQGEVKIYDMIICIVLFFIWHTCRNVREKIIQ